MGSISIASSLGLLFILHPSIISFGGLTSFLPSVLGFLAQFGKIIGGWYSYMRKNWAVNFVFAGLGLEIISEFLMFFYVFSMGSFFSNFALNALISAIPSVILLIYFLTRYKNEFPQT
jgi:hypothetical protein